MLGGPLTILKAVLSFELSACFGYGCCKDFSLDRVHSFPFIRGCFLASLWCSIDFPAADVAGNVLLLLSIACPLPLASGAFLAGFD